jgi:outer membrane protein TolC
MLSYQPYAILTARGAQRSQVRLEQAIPFPGKRTLRGRLAQLTADLARSDVRTIEADLTLEVKMRFYELYLVQEKLALLDRFEVRLTSFEEAAATRYEVGYGGQQEIIKAQIERNDLQRHRLTLIQMRRTAAEAIARLVDRPMEVDSVDLRVDQLPPPPVFDEEGLLASAWAMRSERASLETAKIRAREATALARREYYPDFGLNVTYFDIAKSDIPPTANGRDAVAVGAAVKIPLQRGRLNAQLQERKLHERKLLAQEDELRARIKSEILTTRSQLESQYRQWQLIDEVLIPQAEIALEATLSAYTAGKTSFLDLLDAERMLFSLETGRLDVGVEYLRLIARFERAIGQGLLP